MRLPERPGRRRDREPDITGNRAYSGHIPGIFRAYSGHIRTREDRRMPYRLSSDRVPSGSSRAGAPVAGHGVEKARRVPYRPSPDRVRYRPAPDHVSSRALSPGAGSCAVWPVAGSRLVVSLPVSAPSMSLPWSRLGEPNTRRLPCSGPTAPGADAATGG